ncbi:hypothetical protein PF005_g24600 [Phytophthora fragariae]|uniref:Uncharacterized protein n=1 Tax=Phytophthora fragariae TaxID=53985 RepID=A0A6A3W1E6_9STRA|nr:hypothetical protein PF003_g34246 [Phytophthora fragariae]KAE8924400.1 hypothetical protein PF009_g25367 [Phytophthora fragariae]KAE9076517.1 hypothetical protein PF007_g24600 [Phytophthora fragariae]KAE9177202.1 hypothetical protein PF005_g24600 [Phytophthora fragariae]KAE9184644.1 hypothetical protein PF004_g23596 [Phytophthora fragariae]
MRVLLKAQKRLKFEEEDTNLHAYLVNLQQINPNISDV